MQPGILIAGGALAAVVVVIVAIVAMVLATRRSGPRAAAWGCVEAWQAAAPSLAALGLSRLDAETYTGERLFVMLVPRDRSLRAWLHRATPGGPLEAFLEAEAEIRAGQTGHSPLARFVAQVAGEALASLPRGARLSVEAPDIPGEIYKATLHAPFPAPEVAAAAARVLLALDEAARRPAPAGALAHAKVPRVAMLWGEAARPLEALGLAKLDAETYTRGQLFVMLEPKEERLRAWVHRAHPGGALESFLEGDAELAPGHRGHSPLARFIAGAVGELFARLPRGARLTVEAPDIPGDTYKASLTTPFTTPEDAPAAARVLLALDEAACAPAAGGAPAQVPRVALLWREAAPSLIALGLHALDAETYMRERLSVSLEPREERLRAFLQHVCPGGPLERFLGVDVELAPGHAGHSELARFVAGAVRELLAGLPRGARLFVEAPDIPGDAYKLMLTTPFTAPDQAALAARVLLALDEAARRGR